MGKKVAIVQSNYIPWKGYFNLIKSVDEFVLLEDVQYTRRDWRNRNIIKTVAGLKWLTIPVDVKGKYFIEIKDVHTAGMDWRRQHWNQINDAYRHAPHFSSYSPEFRNLYLSDSEQRLSMINYKFIILINAILGINTPIRWSMEFNSPKEKSERLLHICKSLDAQEYVSGAAAKSYLDLGLFERNNINIRWADYSGFPEYTQLYEPFAHEVSVIDLVFNQGPSSYLFLKDKIWA